MPGYSYFKTYYGPGLTNLEIPAKPNFTITDRAFNSFDFGVDIEYENVRHTWQYRTGTPGSGDYNSTRWYVDLDKVSQVRMGDLPAEVLQLFPNIGAGELEYVQTTLNLQSPESDYYSARGITIYEE
jgi:hypothetical protein